MSEIKFSNFINEDGSNGPECELKLKVEEIRSKGKVWKYRGVAMVNDKIMADSEWMATIVDRKD